MQTNFDTPNIDFVEFPKMARLSREVIVTEKLDGTNASIHITEDGKMFTGSRTRWVVPGDDNFAFAKWANENKEELMKLGPGTHFGEWYGQGIQRKYGLAERRFALFNVHRWGDAEKRPKCCEVVPVLYQGVFDTAKIEEAIEDLRVNGSKAVPGFMKPEGVVVYHVASGIGFKKTVEKDEVPKSLVKEEAVEV